MLGIRARVSLLVFALLGVAACGEEKAPRPSGPEGGSTVPATRYRCPCCAYLTLPEPSPGSLEICHVCFWQDDMVGFNRPNVAVGANAVGLEQARHNYRAFGACERRFVPDVRKPRPEEVPPDAGK